MAAFHSGTDTQDIVESAPKFPFFLSLVVNYKCEAFAEIGVAGEVEIEETRKLRNITLKNPKTQRKSSYTYIIPCDVFYNTDDWLLQQITALKAKNISTVRSFVTPTIPAHRSYVSTYQEPKLGFKIPQPGKTEHNPKGYRKVLEKLADLLLLGTGTIESDATAPSIVFAKVDRELSPTELEDYSKAFKYYYLQFWSTDNFTLFDGDEETLNCVEHFLKQAPNANKWLTPTLKRMVNELRAETAVLRKI